MPGYLRIEVNNFQWLVDDTEDLSTRRGGSLLALELIEYVSKKFENCLKAISTGASAGLFEVLPGNRFVPLQRLADAIRDELSRHSLYKHSTWSVAVSDGEPFMETTETLVYTNRWQQMQNLSFSPEGLLTTGEDVGVCAKDLVRPASLGTELSSSTINKRAKGLGRKRTFYRSQLRQVAPDVAHYLTNDQNSITWDFEDLAKDQQKRFGNLAGKIAVFYADGNKFGKIAQGSESSAQLKAWDDFIKGERRKMLGQVFELASSNAARSQELETEIRLETLLWGGDEIMFVVPAWVGLKLAELFFKSTERWQWPAEHQSLEQPPLQQSPTQQVLPQRLTHACGLVFCKANAPISTIQSLAKDLAERCKMKSRKENLLAFFVLESFDTAGHDIEEATARQFKRKLSFENLILSDSGVFKLVDALPKLAATLPKSSITRALYLLLERPMDDPNWAHRKLLERSYKNIESALEQDRMLDSFKELWLSVTAYSWQVPTPNDDESFVEAQLAGWSTLLTLWDYAVLPEGVSA